MPQGDRSPDVIDAHGKDEVAALTYLELAFVERRCHERPIGIGQLARLAYIQRAEAEALGRAPGGRRSGPIGA